MSFTDGGVWTWPLLVASCVLIVAGTTFSIDLIVTPSEVRVVWWRVLTRHRLDVRNVEDVSTVIAENLVSLFGGYSSRASMEGAMVRVAEGDRSVGNKAIRIRTDDGRVLQVGCWQPTRFNEALEAARGTPSR